MTKVINKIIVAFLVVSFFVFPGMDTTGGVQAQESFPPELAPQLSADGLTLYNGIAPLVVMADPNPEMQGLKATGITADDALAAQATAMSTFSITYVANGGTDLWGEPCYTFPAAAKTAFEAAAAIWATRLQSSVPVTIRACWADLGSSSILGYSGGAPLHRDFAAAPLANTWYEGSLANSLAGSDLAPSDFDDHITYNSGFSWYYGTDGNTPAGQYDLVSVAAHEIGHGLNFSGSASYSGGSGSLGQSGYPVVYDTFMEDGSGNALTTYTSPSTALGNVFTSNNLWFDGPNANAANGGTRVKMYAPSTWAGGSSYSHLDYTTFSGTSNALMVYAIGSGTARHDPGPVTMGLFKDLGWGTGASTVPTPQTPSGTISDRTPTYKWTEVSGATQYQYQLWKGTSVVYTKTVPASACASGVCSNTPTTQLGYNTYKWRVQAMLNGTWGAYSAYKSFTVKNPYIPTPKAPGGSITDTTPTFKWTKVNKATQYQFQLMKGSKAVYIKTVPASACGSTLCQNTPTTKLAVGSYKWRVQAKVGGAWKPYSPYKSFSIQAPLPKAGFWDGNGMDFYVKPDQKNVVNFKIYISVQGCGNYSIWRTTPAPIVNKKFSFSGSYYANGTFDSISKAHGTTGLSSFYLYGCGYVSGGPWSWSAVWVNSSQPGLGQVGEELIVEQISVEEMPAGVQIYTVENVIRE